MRYSIMQAPKSQKTVPQPDPALRCRTADTCCMNALYPFEFPGAESPPDFLAARVRLTLCSLSTAWRGKGLTLCILLQLLGYRCRIPSRCKCRCQYTLPLEQRLALGRQQEIGESDAPGHIFRRIEDSHSIHHGSALGYSVCLGILPGNGGIVGCHRRIAQIDLVRQCNVRNIWPLDLVDVEESGVELPGSQASNQFLFGKDLAGVFVTSQDLLRQARLVIVRLRQLERIDRVHAFGIKQWVGAAQAHAWLRRHLIPRLGAIGSRLEIGGELAVRIVADDHLGTCKIHVPGHVIPIGCAHQLCVELGVCADEDVREAQLSLDLVY